MNKNNGIIFNVLGKRGYVIKQAFDDAGLYCSYQNKITGPRRIFGVIYEIILQIPIIINKGCKAVITDSLEYVPLAWVISKIIKVKFIIRERGDGWGEINQKEKVGGYSMFFSKSVFKIYEILLKQSDLIVCVSDYLCGKVQLNAKIKKDNVIKIPISVNTYKESRQNKIKSINDIYHQKQIISYITNFRFPDKVNMFFKYAEGIDSILNVNTNSIILIAGQGPYLAKFKEKIKSTFKDNENRIICLGYVNNIYSVLSLSEVLLYLTGLDALPRTILEAMSYNVPVIANSFGGIPEIIQHEYNGVLIKTNKELIYYFNKIRNNIKFRKQIVCNANKTISTDFSPKKIGEKWQKLYEDL